MLKGPEGSVDKPFLWTEGRVSLRAALNKSAYGHGEHISVTIDVRNDSRKIIRKMRVSFCCVLCVVFVWCVSDWTPLSMDGW